ncbi:RNA polymerase sigma factor (sigma-70 family) [Ulvibacter sp. MAR_2010_11]|uniref:RNA polymerase sigma factor n=1 Tax=Ulvibacter sp. MAR_2010_11 TaxID=1250229 RepID=UPI000C2C3C7E|nr:RNA polymerase sigma factor [Ulvibacter sp. MAR_2010_11]PKA82557.1 RNA polymerase sigma factor (sigma-70 family) [Ulvibacter sp. MAR_2010_11]
MGKVKNIDRQFQLIADIKTNDESVLRQLYTTNYPKTEKYILKNNGTMPQAKDTYQEAFIAVWKNIKEDKFVPQNETALQGYLYQIAKNKWLDYLRSAAFKKTIHLSSQFSEPYEVESAETLAMTEEKNKQSQISEAFKQLGNECRKLLTTFYYDQQSLREIASVYGIAEASARNKKYRCLQKLRDIILAPKQ